MEPNRREFQKQCAFQSFCKRVLHNEACNAHD
ncbi:MAG: RNA polymerase subunit sigma, partial [Erysipelotrichaceae bacterium]|nr:RNA polymerase subunit sigma [Erysipelotrichaceae bacterium]